jgi:hypothetical protein
MPQPVKSVRLAITALTTSQPRERRQRFDELVTARTALAELIERYEQWLGTEDIALRDHPDVPDFHQREDRWVRRDAIYRDAYEVLQSALLMEKYLLLGRPTGRQMPLDEAPF